jgi:MFS family permease
MDIMEPAKSDAPTFHEQIILEEEPVPHVHAKTYWTVAAMVLIYFAQLLNLVGSGAFRASIAAALGGSNKTTWILATTVIFNCFLGPPMAQAADLWGRKWFLLVPTFCGVIGSVVLASAQTMNIAIAGETICGISYGAQPLLHAISSEVLTHRNRGAAQAAIMLGNGLGGIVALLAGGALTTADPAGFRDYWYMCAGFYALATIVAYFAYNPAVRRAQIQYTTKEKLQRLDWIGYVLAGSGIVLWVLGLEWAGNPCEHIIKPSDHISRTDIN